MVDGASGPFDSQVKVGFPATVWVDQRSEFVSADFDLWAHQRGATLVFSSLAARKADRQRLYPAFNWRFLAECLNPTG